MKRTFIQRILHFLADYFYKLERQSHYQDFRAKREDVPQEVVDLSDMIHLHVEELKDMKHCVDDLWNRLPTDDYKENILVWNCRYWAVLLELNEDMRQHFVARYPETLEGGDWIIETNHEFEKEKAKRWVQSLRKKPR